MAGNFSRRSFLGGFLGAVGASLARKAPDACASPPPGAPPPPAPPPTCATIDPLGSVTTHVYDACGRVVCGSDSLGHITTFTYDCSGR